MKPIYYIGIGLLFALFLVAIVSTCSNNKTEKVITQSQLSSALLNQKDSMKSAYYRIENEKIDSVKAVEALKTKQAIAKAVQSSTIASKALSRANLLQRENDSLKGVNAPCEAQLEKSEEVNQELRIVIAQNDTTIESLGREAESYSRQLYLCEKQNLNSTTLLANKDKTIISLNQINTALSGDLKRKNNWFNRNKLWIGFGLGLTGGILLVK